MSKENEESKVVIEPIVERDATTPGTVDVSDAIREPPLEEKIGTQDVFVDDPVEDPYGSIGNMLENALNNAAKLKESPDAPPAESSARQPEEEAVAEDSAQTPQPKPTEAEPKEPAAPTAEEIAELVKPGEAREEKFIPRRTGARIARLREVAQHLSKQVTELSNKRTQDEQAMAELRAKLEALEKGGGQSGQDASKQLERLAMLERRYEIESSDEIKTRFDGPISQISEDVKSILASANFDLQSDLAKELSERGPARMSKEFPEVFEGLLVILEKGSPEHGFVATAQSRLQARRLEALALRDEELRNSRAKWVEEQTRMASEYFAKQRQQSAAVAQQAKMLLEQRNKERDAGFSEVVSNPLFTPPKDAPADRVQALERARQIARVAIDADDTKTRAQIALLAAASEVRAADLKAAQARIADLESQIAKLKGASRTVPQTGASAPRTTGPKPTTAYVTPDGLTDWTAVGNALERNRITTVS